MCRKLSIFLLVLLLASASVWAFPGRQTGSRETEAIAISVPEAQEEALNPDSGNQAETISTEPQTSYVVQEASAKVEAGKRLTAMARDKTPTMMCSFAEKRSAWPGSKPYT